MRTDNQFAVRISFVEVVGAEKRSFVHDIAVTGSGFSDACVAALDDFYSLAGHSNVGWIRTVEGVEVRRLPSDRLDHDTNPRTLRTDGRE